jgi:hypothetical protein
MTEHQRLSLIVQSLAVGVGLFIALTWVFSLTADVEHRLWLNYKDVFPYKVRVVFKWIAIGLPFVITLGILGVMIRCLKKSK